jgi:hypothetical protein
MLRRIDSLNYPYDGPAPDACRELEQNGHCILRQVFTADEVAALRDEIDGVYRTVPPEMRDSAISPEVGAMYRYQMFNHGARCQAAIAHRRILDVLEPLLGGDCHVIACTAWRNPPGNALTPNGLQWHVDGGPFVPMPEGVRWPAAIAFPIFVVATHLYLQDVGLDDGPTACLPGSHRGGRVPPLERCWDLDLEFDGQRPVLHTVRAGDVDFRISDVWHRRWPPGPNARGRFFLQTNYARRDIAQRVLPTAQVHHVAPAAIARATTDRERRLLGLHPQSYFDA